MLVSALQAGALMAGLLVPPRDGTPGGVPAENGARAKRLLLAQRSLNLCRDAIPRAEALKGEKAQATLEKLKQEEKRLLDEIKELGGMPDPGVGKLTIHDLPTPQELHQEITQRLLATYRKAQAGIQAEIKKVEGMEEGGRKAEALKSLREQDAFYAQLIEGLERGSLKPRMQVIPRLPTAPEKPQKWWD
jgi:hypothetical protein